MVKLHELIAIEKDTKSIVEDLVKKAKAAFSTLDLFTGFHRKYEPISADDPERFDAELVNVRLSVSKCFEDIKRAFVKITDLIVTKEGANAQAKGSIVVSEDFEIKDVPVQALVQMEKHFESLVQIAITIPVLDGTKEWNKDTSNKHLYRTNPKKATRTRKEEYPLVLYDATPEHPAQTKVAVRDIPAGYWEKTDFSGAITPDEKDDIVKRAQSTLAAIKKARSRANIAEVKAVNIGGKLIDYILTGK